MFFNRTHNYVLPMSKETLTNRLLGKHVSIHKIDFEVFEEDGLLHIIPHDEQEEAIKTLPFTRLELVDNGNETTKVTTRFTMRQIDSGGPILVVIFSLFLLIASGFLYFLGGFGERPIMYTMLGAAVLIIVLFSYRLQTGYFDYIRKISSYIKEKGEFAVSGMTMPVATA